MSKNVVCKGCGAEIYKGVKRCPQCGKKNKKPTGLIIIGIIVLLIIITSISDSMKETKEKKVEYSWPSNGIATLLPQPESVYGEIYSESETYFSIDVYDVSLTEFREYVDNCKEEGFTVDYHGSSTSYYADDANGNSLSLFYYEQEKEMNISITAFSKEIEKDTVENVVDTEDSQTEEDIDVLEKTEDSDADVSETEEIDAEVSEKNDVEFRAWVDSYEEFMNEYVEFMKKYNESDGTDLTLLADYTSFLTKYNEFIKDTETVSEDELSAEDYKYYLDAQTRIWEKLSEIQ